MLISQLKKGDRLLCMVNTHTMNSGDTVIITDINERIFIFGHIGVERRYISSRFMYITPTLLNEKIVDL